jgi:hypothetical protein
MNKFSQPVVQPLGQFLDGRETQNCHDVIGVFFTILIDKREWGRTFLIISFLP